MLERPVEGHVRDTDDRLALARDEEETPRRVLERAVDGCLEPRRVERMLGELRSEQIEERRPFRRRRLPDLHGPSIRREAPDGYVPQ